jgi:hypothetical protein
MKSTVRFRLHPVKGLRQQFAVKKYRHDARLERLSQTTGGWRERDRPAQPRHDQGIYGPQRGWPEGRICSVRKSENSSLSRWPSPCAATAALRCTPRPRSSMARPRKRLRKHSGLRLASMPGQRLSTPHALWMHSGNIHALPRRTKRIPSPICVGELGWSAACSGLGARCIARIAQADACSR